MYSNFILLIFLWILISINSQQGNERDLPSERSQVGGISKSLFDDRFNRGRCPQPFYQSGDECLYFSTDDKIYSWKQAEQTCLREISHMVAQQQTSLMGNPATITSTRGARQMILNTPEKVEIFRVLFREYQQQNFAVRLSSDYNKLKQCLDKKDVEWLHYCADSKRSNSTCLEIRSNGLNNICLREVNCNEKHLSLACEFTLPGSAEITTSKFRHCPETDVGALSSEVAAAIVFGLLLIGIMSGVICFCIQKRRYSSRNKKITRTTTTVTTYVPVKREDSADELMVVRTIPIGVHDTSYFQPQPLKRVFRLTGHDAEYV